MDTKIEIGIYPGIVFTVNDTGEYIGKNHIDIFVDVLTVDEANKLGLKYSKVYNAWR